MEPDTPSSTVARHANTPTAVALPGPSPQDEVQQCHRSEIELQLKTMAEYIRNKKLRPLQWACCHCSRRQQFRDTLDLFDGLRCVDPTCGVSEKGFRICRVHEMCDACTLLVDKRVPVTTRGLKRKREEVREVLKKVKKVYDELDRLVGFDEAEAGRVARETEEKAAKDELRREQLAEEQMYRAEMERRQNVAEAMAMEYREETLGDGFQEYEDEGDEEAQEDDGHEQEEVALPRHHQQRQIGKKMKGGIASLLGLSSGKEYI